jgi:Family of unknown function (DUF6876)
LLIGEECIEKVPIKFAKDEIMTLRPETVTPEQLEAELAQFIGTRHYYRHIGNMVLTDGAKHLADRAGAYCLMDVVASWQLAERVACERFQLWKIEVHDHKATVMADDGNGKELARQEIPCTEFPLRSQSLYLVNDGKYRVLMLPSEY